MKSAHLIRTLDERLQKRSNLQEFDISIADKTRAVYKLAQFEYSRRLAKANSDIAFMIFSEFSLHYKSARNDHQRNMVVAILPWLQTLELQVDPGTNGPTAVSYMILANMFEITICSIGAMHNEVQALWQALATGPHAGNVQLILDFIIYLSLDRRDQNFVEYAKQIVVYLSSTPAGSRVLEFFMLQLTPKNMVNDRKHADVVMPDSRHLPYVADLNSLLPMGNKQVGLSMGQVSLIFLVDLMVTPVTLGKDEAIKLIHTVLILWDHYTTSVQEQAREMLVHLIHELVTTKIEPQALASAKSQIESLVESVRTNDPRSSTGDVDANCRNR
ncbi:Cell morphogenesis protein PAG1 [Exophiala xenobiotica]|nr:Cell morphogenesis protein PAG1 [Exophiala xenobiotica]